MTRLFRLLVGLCVLALVTPALAQTVPCASNAHLTCAPQQIQDTNGNGVNVSATNPVPISGTITASNPSVGTNASANPGSSTQIGSVVGGNLQPASASNPIPTVQTGALPAGTNIIGKVGIDQTTPGTTNAVAATNFPAAVSTGTGAQGASSPRVTVATDGATVAGSAPGTVAAGAAPVNGVPALGQYSNNANIPAPTTGQTVGAQTDPAGNLRTAPQRPVTADILDGYQTFTSTTGATTVITVSAGRTWVGTISAHVSCQEAAAGAVACQARAVFTTAGTNVTPAAGTYFACEAKNGANAASGLVGDGTSNFCSTPFTIVAPVGNTVTIQVASTNAGTASVVDASAIGVMQ